MENIPIMITIATGAPNMDKNTIATIGMAIKLRIELLAIGQFDNHALERLVVERLAGRVEHSDPPNYLFEALELVAEHAERAGRALLRPAHQIAFEEQLFGRGSLGVRRLHEGQYGYRGDRYKSFHKWFLSTIPRARSYGFKLLIRNCAPNDKLGSR